MATGGGARINIRTILHHRSFQGVSVSNQTRLRLINIEGMQLTTKPKPPVRQHVSPQPNCQTAGNSTRTWPAPSRIHIRQTTNDSLVAAGQALIVRMANTALSQLLTTGRQTWSRNEKFQANPGTKMSLAVGMILAFPFKNLWLNWLAAGRPRSTSRLGIKATMNTNISDLPVKPASDGTATGANPKNASKRCLDINEFMNSAIMIADEMIREKGLVATGFQVVEPGGLYVLCRDPGENFRHFLENILLICQAPDLDFGLLIVPSVDPNKRLAGKLTNSEWGHLMIQVALVVEDRHGQRIEKVLPVLRDAGGKFTGFG